MLRVLRLQTVLPCTVIPFWSCELLSQLWVSNHVSPVPIQYHSTHIFCSFCCVYRTEALSTHTRESIGVIWFDWKLTTVRVELKVHILVVYFLVLSIKCSNLDWIQCYWWRIYYSCLWFASFVAIPTPSIHLVYLPYCTQWSLFQIGDRSKVEVIIQINGHWLCKWCGIVCLINVCKSKKKLSGHLK